MQPGFIRKLKTLALVCLFTSIAGVIYQLINEAHLNYNSVLIGLPLGLVFGLLELFLLPRFEMHFLEWSFTKMLLVKTLLYTAVIYLVTIGLTIIGGWIEGRKLSELPPHLLSADSLILIMYTLVIYGLLVFFLQITRLLGQGILWKFVSGKYRRPREEERIFMFLDMKSSTTIAEQLGHIRFYTLLNELFHEISEPVLQTKAEIYQYVGDEVVLTWKLKDGLENSNCLKAFFLFRESLARNGESYFRSFGIKPEFKAGLHFGKVISAQIGDLKKEVIYNGDVVNTTARIQDECNKYQRDCLVSGTLMKQLQSTDGFEWEWLETVTLRGKETEVELFSVNRTYPKLFAMSGNSESALV
jgi:adenylate cyclase